MGGIPFARKTLISPYKQDLKTIDFHILDTGHFALEEKRSLGST